MRAVSELCLFPHVSDSVLIRTDLMNDATSSWARLLSSTPRESSVKSLRQLGRFGLSAVTSELITSELFVEDDFGDDYLSENDLSETGDFRLGVSHSIPDGIPPPPLRVVDSNVSEDNESVATIASSVSDTANDTRESNESGFDFELPDDLPIGCPLLGDAFSSGFINFGLTLAVEKEEDDVGHYSFSSGALSTVSSVEDNFGGDNILFAGITPSVSKQKREDGDHLEEATDMDIALISAAVEAKQVAAVRSLIHSRKEQDSAEDSLRANAGTELLKRQRNADGTRRFDFSVYVDISQASVDHILGLLHIANLK